jgi:hypothetical protein
MTMHDSETPILDSDGTPLHEVQWYSGGSGGGVRSWMLYGVSRVHLVRAGEYDTLCDAPRGRARRRTITPDAGSPRCLKCRRIAERPR